MQRPREFDRDRVPTASVMAAFGASVVVGVAFGIYPTGHGLAGSIRLTRWGARFEKARVATASVMVA